VEETVNAGQGGGTEAERAGQEAERPSLQEN
jgi:hypothetical protein